MTHRLVWIGSLLASLVLAPLTPARAAVLELQHLQLIDGTAAPLRPVQRLVAVDGRIVAIDKAGSVPEQVPHQPWTRIDLGGAVVMPGLIDTHVHVARFPETRARAKRILMAGLRGGVTAVRDLVGDARALSDLAREVDAGEWLGPTIVYSALFGGPDVFKGGPTAQMSPGMKPGTAAWARQIDADTDFRAVLLEARGTGARNIKIYGDLLPEQVQGLTREGHAAGMLVTAHGTVFPTKPSELVAAGVDSLAHVPYLIWEAEDTVPDDYSARIRGRWTEIPANHPKLLALYQLMAAKQVNLDATLFVYRNMQNYPGAPSAEWSKHAFHWGAEATRLAHQAGVPISTGTDWFEGLSEDALPNTHQELQLLVEHAGFTPMEAIVAGTRNGAQAIGKADTLGTLEIGKQLDALVLDANPLEDIQNTQAIRQVIVRGELLSNRP